MAALYAAYLMAMKQRKAVLRAAIVGIFGIHNHYGSCIMLGPFPPIFDTLSTLRGK